MMEMMEYADVEELTYVTIPGEPSLSLEEFDASRMLRLTSITYSNIRRSETAI